MPSRNHSVVTAWALALMLASVSARAQDASPTSTEKAREVVAGMGTTQASPPPRPWPSVRPADEDSAKTPRADAGQWYGWQTLTVVGIATAPLSLAPSEEGVVLAVGGVFLGPPIVHWANGNVGTGFASLALGLGSTATGGLAGAAIGHEDCGPDSGDFCGAGGVILGILGAITGAVAYVAVDASVLARTRGSDEPRAQEPHWALRLAPRVAVTKEIGSIGLGGSF